MRRRLTWHVCIAASLALCAMPLGAVQAETVHPLITALDKNDDGKLSADEMPGPLRKRLMPRADTNGDGVLTTDEVPDNVWQMILSRFDKNGNGKLDDGELPGGRGRAAQPKTDNALLNRFDANKDGKLVPDELPQRLRSKMMSFADKDLDGELAVEELPDTLWKLVLENYDANGNGKLEDEELKPRERGNMLEAARAKYADKVKVISDIEYATGPEYANDRGKLDLYLPKGRKNFPVMLFIHGGALMKGDKASVGPVSMRFATDGFGMVATNYRLSSDNAKIKKATYPDFIEDVAKAFSWVYDNIGKYGGDRKRIFVTGGSAGGHLTALLALDPSFLEAQGLSTKNIKGAIPISGLVDASTAGEVRIAIQWHGDPEIAKKGSPMTHVRKDAPPMLILVADNESQQRIDQNKKMYEALKNCPT